MVGKFKHTRQIQAQVQKIFTVYNHYNSDINNPLCCSISDSNPFFVENYVTFLHPKHIVLLLSHLTMLSLLQLQSLHKPHKCSWSANYNLILFDFPWSSPCHFFRRWARSSSKGSSYFAAVLYKSGRDTDGLQWLLVFKGCQLREQLWMADRLT